MSDLTGKFVFAPIEVFSDHRLGVIELRVLLTLYSFRDKDDAYVWPHRDAIAARSGYGNTTVSRAVSKLVKYGWLKVKQNRGPNHYYLKLEGTVTELETVTDPATVSDQVTVTNSVINSDRFGHETVTDPATPEHTKNKPIELNKAKPSVTPCPHPEIIDLYHDTLPELPRVVESRWAGSTRAKNLVARWREDKRHQDLEFWKWLFESMKGNAFWLGENERGWRADLEWIVKRSNFDKILQHAVNQHNQRRATS